jgi:uncharacterized membrane protein
VNTRFSRWGGGADRGDAARLEAFSDGVLAIAITLLILEVRVDAHKPLGVALAEAMPHILAYVATFLQIGIMWANHHTLFRSIARIDQLLLLSNLLLLGVVSFLPFPTGLIAEHLTGTDGRLAMLLYGGTLTAAAAAFNLIWQRASRSGLLVAGISKEFRRDVSRRYLLGLLAYAIATAAALIQPWLTLVLSAILALAFVLGPSPRQAVEE